MTMKEENQQVERLQKVSKILVSQPKPADEKSPYFTLEKEYNVKIDFKQFIKIEPLAYKEFRKQKVDILSHTAVIFTSRNAVDNFFKICQEGKIELPADYKYFCVNEQTANYLQKYITVRKRKVFVGTKTSAELIEIIKKHKTEKFLYPCSSIRKDDIPLFLSANSFEFTEAVIYQTVSENLEGINMQEYDLIAFFSPSGVTSLKSNFPDFQQKHIRFAAFGPTTAKSIIESGFKLDIEAPMPNAPSMTGALEQYIIKANNVIK
ncbi:MAG: uroporphyrinogen-III synthase [Cytophagales bacterium]